MKLPEIIGGVVLLVSATAGTITWSDLRYALRLETETKIAGLAVQYQQSREETNARQIYELDREKAKRGKLSDRGEGIRPAQKGKGENQRGDPETAEGEQIVNGNALKINPKVAGGGMAGT